MNKKIKVFCFGFAGLVFVACAGFNPNNKSVKFFNGQAYHVPYYTTYWEPYSGAAAERVSQAGVPCSSDAVVWVANNNIKNSGQLTPEVVRSAYSQGLLGCASPLSNQELQYIQHRENIKQQQSIQADMQLQHMQMMNQQQQLEFQRQQQYQMNRFMYGY